MHREVMSSSQVYYTTENEKEKYLLIITQQDVTTFYCELNERISLMMNFRDINIFGMPQVVYRAHECFPEPNQHSSKMDHSRSQKLCNIRESVKWIWPEFQLVYLFEREQPNKLCKWKSTRKFYQNQTKRLVLVSMIMMMYCVLYRFRMNIYH